MARKTYTSSLEQSLDERIEALKSARDEAEQAERQKAASGAGIEAVGGPMLPPPTRAPAARRRAGRGTRGIVIAIVVVLVALGLVLALMLATVPGAISPGQTQPTVTVGPGATATGGVATSTPGGPAPTATVTSPAATATSSAVVYPPGPFVISPGVPAIVWVLLVLLLLLLALAVVGMVITGRRRRRAGRAGARGAQLAEAPVDVLEERITRLEQIRAWLKQDSSLMGMVDEVIGQKVQAATRTQMVFSAILGVVSLLVGWLLSAVTPPHVLLP